MSLHSLKLQIYLVHAPPESYLSRTDGKPYERSDYYANPTEYKSDFCTNVSSTIPSH